MIKLTDMLNEDAEFNRANKEVHQVKDQWHYPIMTKAGWKAITKTGVGFVRAYDYKHSKHKNTIIRVTTGSSGDYWRVSVDGGSFAGGGYWSTLAPYLKTL